MKTLLCAAAMALTLVACESSDKTGTASEPVAAAETAKAAPAKDCAKDVLSTSEHAVGAPCSTTADIAKKAGLTDAQIAKLSSIKVGKKAAHH